MKMDLPARKKRRCESDASSTEPAKKSFLNQVADSVKELLTPSWLSALVNSGRQESESGSTQQEAVANAENFATPQYGSRQSNSQPTYSQQQFDTHPAMDATVPSQPLPAGRYMVAGEDTPSVPIVPMTQSVNTPFAGSDDYRQQHAQASKSSLTGQRRDSSNGYRPAESPHSNNDMVRSRCDRESRRDSYRRQSEVAIGTRGGTPPRDLNESRSSFNMSAFAKSYSESMDASMLNSSNIGNSSYYPGKTVYGGVANRRSFSIPNCTPYKRVTQARTQNAAKGANPLGATSSAAKLILKALDQTGMEQAKSVSSSGASSRLFSPAVYLRRREPVTKNTAINTPPVSGILKSSQAKITPNVHKQEIRQPFSVSFGESYSSVSIVKQSYNTAKSAAAFSGKVKRDRSHGHYNSCKPMMDEVPNLSTSYTLNFSNSSQLNLGAAASLSSAKFAFSQPKSVPKTAVILPPSPTLEPFRFTAPSDVGSVVKVFPKGLSAAKSPEKPAAATAGLDAVPSTSGAQKLIGQGSDNTTGNWGELMAKSGEKWSCADCLLQNDKGATQCVACSGPRPGTKIVAGASTSTSSSAAGWGNLLQSSSNKWSCETCLVQNDAETEKCLACGTQNPAQKETASTASNVPVASGWGDLFKNSASKWSCDRCLVQNEVTAEKCLSCGSAKAATAAPSTKFPGFGPGGATTNWSCTTCLVQNEATANKCVACGTENQKANKSSAAAPTASGWGDLFKNLSNKWSCDECLIQNEANVDKCVACAASKPSAASSSFQSNALADTGQTSGWGNLFAQEGGKWGCGSCLLQNDNGKTACASCGARKPAERGAATAVGQTGLPFQQPKGNWDSFFQNAPKKWNCAVCSSPNEIDAAECAACNTPAPATEEAVSSSNWGSFLQKQSSEWSCEACLVSNPADKQSCLACGTASPTASTANKDLTGTVAAGWGKQQDWKCTTCLVCNQSNISLCDSCGAYKPGTQSSLGDLDKGRQLPIYEQKPKSENKGFSGLSSLFPAKPAPDASANDDVAISKSGEPTASGFSMFSFSKQTTNADDVSKSAAKPAEDKAVSSPAAAPSTGFTISLFPKAFASTDSQKSETPKSAISSEAPASAAAPTALFTFGNTSAAPATQSAPEPSQPSQPSQPTFQFGFNQPTLTQPSEGSSQTLSNLGQTLNKPVPFSFGQPKGETSQSGAGGLFAATSFSSAAGTQPTFTFGNPMTTLPSAATSDSKSIFSVGQVNNPSSNASDIAASNSPFGNAIGSFNNGQKRRASVFGEKDEGTASKVPSFAFGSGGGAPLFGSSTGKPKYGDSSDKPAFGTLSNNPVFGTSSNAPVFGDTGTSSIFGDSVDKPFFGSSVPSEFGASSPLSASSLFTANSQSSSASSSRTTTPMPFNNGSTLPIQPSDSSTGFTVGTRTIKKATRRIKK